jgi:hypothetical protein
MLSYNQLKSPCNETYLFFSGRHIYDNGLQEIVQDRLQDGHRDLLQLVRDRQCTGMD